MKTIAQALLIGSLITANGCGSSGDESTTNQSSADELQTDILAGEPADGEWGYHNGVWSHFGTSTYFGEDYRNVVLRIGCGRDPFQFVVLRELGEVISGETPVRIVTPESEHIYTGAASTLDVPMIGVTPGVEVRFDLNDPVADQLASNEGTFAVVIGDGDPLVVRASDGEIANMVSSCRNAAQSSE